MAGISIIIPTYESWPLLQRTLASLVADARELDASWEIIVVDNESQSSLIEKIRRISPGQVKIHQRTGLGGHHFQPGAARNIGVEIASYDSLIFLDADCIPAPSLLRTYWQRLQVAPNTVLIGHREFVDASTYEPDRIASDRSVLDRADRVPSESNYGRTDDRRLPELHRLDRHKHPYDCLYSCNFAVHRDTLGRLRFDRAYDGFWGYEDIDLGYRLHRAGRQFEYLASAYVYHQEGGPVSADQRRNDRRRNLRIIARRIPGFLRYRMKSSRPGSAHEMPAGHRARARWAPASARARKSRLSAVSSL
jgi:GT2 family glycosyltransferase